MDRIATTDRELVEASRRGELDAFGHLVARYRDLVCAVSYSSTGDRALSEDVAQDTFVAAWRQIDRARPATLRPWLCGIARNLGRKARRRTRREEPIDADAHPASDATPFDEVARADAERLVREALDRVPETYREVLVLYYREGQSVKGVAETLGIGEAAVMQRLSRGRRYLADGVTSLVERSLRGTRPRRDLVAAVLAAIAAFAIPVRVDASPLSAKGSTMLKLTLAASVLAVAGTTAYLVHAHHAAAPALAGHAHGVATTASGARVLHYGAGIAHAPTLAATTSHRAVAARAQAADDLPYLPADADTVIGIDVAQVRGSAMWQQLVQPALSGYAWLAQFFSVCGFDPIASSTSVSVGLHGFGADAPPSGTVVIHGFDKAKALACATAAAPQGTSVTVDSGVVLVTGPDGYHIGATFPDDTTAVVVLGSAAATRAGVLAVAAGNGGLDAASGFGTLFANVDPSDPLWFVVTDDSPLLASINSELAHVSAVQLHGAFASLGMTDRFELNGGIRLATPTLAAQLVSEAQTALDALAARGPTTPYFDQLDVVSQDRDVLLDTALTVPQFIAFASSGMLKVDVD